MFSCVEIKLDPGFVTFSDWCRAQSPPIPLILVSSGMEPIIRAICEEALGKEAADALDIISNDVDRGSGPNDWSIVYRHPESGFGHVRPLLLFDSSHKADDRRVSPSRPACRTSRKRSSHSRPSPIDQHLPSLAMACRI